jgi:hypothetical protein
MRQPEQSASDLCQYLYDSFRADRLGKYRKHWRLLSP